MAVEVEEADAELLQALDSLETAARSAQQQPTAAQLALPAAAMPDTAVESPDPPCTQLDTELLASIDSLERAATAARKQQQQQQHQQLARQQVAPLLLPPSQQQGGERVPRHAHGRGGAPAAHDERAPVAAKRARRLPVALSMGAPQPLATGALATENGNLPQLLLNGAVHYLHIPHDVEAACQRLMQSGVSVVGWDVEWTVTYQTGVTPRPIALIQMCHAVPGVQRYVCLLLHITHSGLDPALPPALRSVLCAPTLLKVGAGAHGDALKIARDFGLEMGGVLDVSGDYANSRLCSCGQEPQKWSLAALVARLLHRGLGKGSVRCSHWERCPLSQEQVLYAATDAFASLRVYEELHKLPVVQQPALLPAAPDGTAPTGDAGSLAAGAPGGAGLIPALPLPGPLQPAKLAVYGEHRAGASVQHIAERRRILPDSVAGYLAEALVAGYAYSWEALGVSQAVLEAVAKVASRLLQRDLCCQPPAALTSPQACDAAAAPADVQPVPMLQRLLETGQSMRQLKEEHWPDITYGDLRLALAHLGRCNHEPWG